MHIDYPWRFNLQGRTAATTRVDHVRDMIEQVLLTAPGERVNRPEFGVGLREILFDGAGQFAAESIAVTARAALLRWLPDDVELVDVTADGVDSALHLTVSYRILGLDDPLSRPRQNDFLFERQAP